MLMGSLVSMISFFTYALRGASQTIVRMKDESEWGKSERFFRHAVCIPPVRIAKDLGEN